MVRGFDIFIEYFKEFPDSYVIIGGTACDIIVEDAGFVPRITDDIDIILIVEALSPEFVKRFWDFVKDGKYNTRQKDFEKRTCYRFSNPGTKGFPQQIELFSKSPDIIDPEPGSYLIPVPVGEGLSDLSAILLNDDYYRFTLEHSDFINSIHYANTEAIICLKAFAYLDNKRRKEEGKEIRTVDIEKHKKDVFRLAFLLEPDLSVDLPETIKQDMLAFAADVNNDLPDQAIFKVNRFGKQDMKTIFNQLVKNFNLTLNE